MSFDPNDLTGDLDGLSPDELEVLQDWEEKFKERYPRVGHLACQDAAGSGQNTAGLHHEEGTPNSTGLSRPLFYLLLDISL
ncbi:unnamed protein product [Miscanthus lutarioriparius]|uniref:Uncharacterized protein n=1 Tax=Miscanthus lutarioriparius TaxID=422564 RepID=A0A811MET1_9POAL|nr:unnamed protein product [Miscanthus lutarioriparius]